MLNIFFARIGISVAENIGICKGKSEKECGVHMVHFGLYTHTYTYIDWLYNLIYTYVTLIAQFSRHGGVLENESN